MIDIIILVEEINTEFTLASLLKNDENFRIHLFNRRGLLIENMEPTIRWALANFREVHSYQTPYSFKGKNSHRMARVLSQFREHWKDKQPPGGPIERVIVHTKGCRIFNGDIGKNIPTVSQMGDRVVYFSRKHQYFDHKFYGNYYQILGLEAKKDDHELDFMLVNWKKFKACNPHQMFLINGKANEYQIPGSGEFLNKTDSYILSANNDEMFKYLKESNHGYMPMYFDMNVDELIKKESIGPKDTINHNVMMRKAFSLSMDTAELFIEYHQLPTLFYMAVPWDMWSKLIDEIPINRRREGFNERILQKADKQKKYLRKIVEAGYLLGKI
jgi:hypothetical protein